MGGPPGDNSAPPKPAALAELAIPPVGTVLMGKYRVEGVIGVGGMGFVVAAFHETLKKRVAMKMLLPELARRSDVRARFEREAQAAFSLKSEHICRVLDAGELPNGQLFITMEYLKGEDLGSILKQRGKLPPDQAIEYILQACEGLSEAHELEMVHRDLKPANLILVKRRDGTPCIKIIDFGISKLRTDEGEEELTKASAYVGSPLYSSPEQLVAAHFSTARSDVWSLGVILYRLLTGAHPFPKSDDIKKLVNAIRFNEPKPLLAREPSLNPALEGVMYRCLHKDPAARYASASELHAALLPLAGPRPTPDMASSGSFSHAMFHTPQAGVHAADSSTTSSNPFGYSGRGMPTFAGPGEISTNQSVMRRSGVVSEAEESGGSGWVSILALIAAALTVAFVAWRSQQGLAVPPKPVPAPSVSVASDPLLTEPVASASAAPSSSSKSKGAPRGAASHAAPRTSASTLTTPPPQAPPEFRDMRAR